MQSHSREATVRPRRRGEAASYYHISNQILTPRYIMLSLCGGHLDKFNLPKGENSTPSWISLLDPIHSRKKTLYKTLLDSTKFVTFTATKRETDKNTFTEGREKKELIL